MINPSVTDPMKPAWDRMKQLLFRPFDLGAWFAIGFAAWLTTLMQQGASIPGGNFGDPGFSDQQQIGAWIQEHLVLIAVIAGAFLLFLVVWSLLATWLSCRGRFMLLHQLVNNTTEVKAPWKEYAREGNRLFVWSIVFGFFSLLLIGVPLGIAGFLLAPVFQGGTWETIHIFTTAFIGVLLFALFIALLGVWFYLQECVAPLMMKHRCSVGEAWGRLLTCAQVHPGTFILYPLFRAVLQFAITIGVLLAVLLTCCIAGLVLMIPYINAVVMLPITAFLSYFSLEFLRQFGPDYDLWETPPIPLEPDDNDMP